MGMMEGVTTLIVLGVQDRIDVEQEGYANILVITATDTNPTLAQLLANKLAEVYRQHEYESKNKQARKTREFVEQQIFAARDSLAMAEDEAKTFREDNDLLSIEAQASLVFRMISEVESTKNTTQEVIAVIDSILAAKCQARKSGYGRLCKRVFGGGLCSGELGVFDLGIDRDFLFANGTVAN